VCESDDGGVGQLYGDTCVGGAFVGAGAINS
jgi:hypothetical protein